MLTFMLTEALRDWRGNISPVRVVVLVAVVVGTPFGIRGVRNYVAEGERAALAMPPRIVAEKSHTVESHSFSCGKGCVSTSNTDVFTLFAVDGSACDVDARTFAQVARGQAYKCGNLYGWSEP